MAEKRGSCFFRLLKTLLLLIVLLVVLAVALVLLAIGDPVSYPAPKFDARDTSTVANIITRLARSLVDKESRVVETAVLKLSQNEVQTLLNAMIRDDRENAPETVPSAVIWEGGKIRLFFSGSLKFGKAANLFAELTPFVDDGQLTIVPGSGSVGKLPMSQRIMNKIARLVEKDAMSREKVRTALSAFKRIEPGDDGTLVLMFDPLHVNRVVRILRSAGKDPSAPDDEDDEDDGEDYDDGEDEPEEEDAEDYL